MNAYIIAEMAWSHNGSLDRALAMLDGAKNGGANAISIHLTDLPSYMVKDYKCIEGTTLSDSSDSQASIYDFLDEINLSKTHWKTFGEHANKIGIDLVVMCNDQISFEFSKTLHIKRYVIAPATFLEDHLIQSVVQQNNDIILRTGGATMIEIESVVKKILSMDANATICLLAGIQLYPTPIEDLNLSSLTALYQKFDDPRILVGLADHIDGDHPFAIHLPALALAYGATTLEKHITTDRKEKLEDYEAALGIEQFADFVDYIRTSERALGSGSLDYMNDSVSYQKYRGVSRKKVVAARELTEGTILTTEMLSYKRADYGASLEVVDQLIGRPLKKNKNQDEAINVQDVNIER